jgi:hypothetical protein
VGSSGQPLKFIKREELKMLITLKLLQEKDACADGQKWFVDHFPEGGEYQTVLDAFAQDNQSDYAQWLLNKMGGTSDVLELDEITGNNFFFAGSIRIKNGIVLTGALKIGSGIEAGWGIKAGDGYGIFAGPHVKINEWSIRAKISASVKPENLMTGFWVGLK